MEGRGKIGVKESEGGMIIKLIIVIEGIWCRFVQHRRRSKMQFRNSVSL